jgi:hypothetical protein
MVELRQYTVTAYSGLYEICQGPTATVTTAASPELAAELILGERLVRFGMVRDLRAKVSYEELGGVKTILLYRPPS